MTTTTKTPIDDKSKTLVAIAVAKRLKDCDDLGDFFADFICSCYSSGLVIKRVIDMDLSPDDWNLYTHQYLYKGQTEYDFLMDSFDTIANYENAFIRMKNFLDIILDWSNFDKTKIGEF